jgi:hypothetical protein
MASADLATAIANIDRAIKNLSENPRPDMSVGGRSYSMASLLTGLIQQKKVLMQAYQDSDGPFEVVDVGSTGWTPYVN